MKLRISLAIFLATVCLGAQPLWAQQREGYEIDFSKSRFDSLTIDLCNRFIPTPLQIAIVSSGIHARMIPSVIAVADYPSRAAKPEMKLLYTTDAKLFATLVILKPTADGDWEQLAMTQDAPPGVRLRIRCQDVTGNGKQEIILTSRGGEPMLETMMVFRVKDDGVVQRICERTKNPYDVRAPQGVAIGIIDSVGTDGRPALEVWQDDSLHFASSYTRVLLQYDEKSAYFVPTSIDTFPALPKWCDGRRAMYLPDNK